MVIVVTEKGGTPKRIEFQKSEVTVGRVQGNDIVLPKGNVSKQHSRIVLDGDKFVIFDLKSTNGTYVNSRKISGPQVVSQEDKIYIGDFMLQVEGAPSLAAPSPLPVAKPVEEIPPPAMRPSPMAPPPRVPAAPAMPPAMPPATPPPGRLASGGPVAPRPGPAGPAGQRRPPAATMALDAPQERRVSSAASPVPSPPPRGPSIGGIGAKSVEPARLESARMERAESARIEPQRPTSSPPIADAPPPAMQVIPMPVAPAAPVAPAPEAARPRLKAYFEPPLDESDPVRADRLRTRALILERLGEQIDITDPGQKGGPVPELWEQAHQIICDLVQEMAAQNELPAGIDQDRLIQDARAEALAIGPLEEFLADEDVLEVFVNGPHQILTVRRAETRLEENAFATELGLLAAINRLLGASGRFLDQEQGGINYKLRDGTRLVACFPPASSRGTTLLLRKYLREAPPLAELIAQGFLSEAIAGFLENSVRERRPIIVAGGLDAGQKMLLGSLAQIVPPEERVALIEDIPELAVYHPQLMQFEMGPHLALAQVLRLGVSRLVIPNLLALKPDNMVTALHSGIDGALLGALSQGIEDAIERVCFAAAQALPNSKPAAFRDMLLRAMPVFVFVNRFSDGSRRVVQMAEVGEGFALREIDIR